MPVVTEVALSVAANAKSTERLQGTQLAFAPYAGTLGFYPVAAAAGIRATLMVGNEVVVDDQPVSNANRFPNEQDDLLWGGEVGEMEQLRLFFRNDTGGAVTVSYKMRLD